MEVTLRHHGRLAGDGAAGDINPGELTGLGWTSWPRVSDWPSIEFHTFQPSQRVRVSYQGNVLLEQTFTLDDVKRITPPCAAVIDTPGVYD